MKVKVFISIIMTTVFFSCVSIPKETIELSTVLGSDLKILHKSHKALVELYYDEIIDNINVFIDEVYSPFVIHYVLKIEFDKYKNNEESLYKSIEAAGMDDGKTETDKALQDMSEFIEDAKAQIESKRKDLLQPIIQQKNDLLAEINTSYESAIYANSTITGYLKSVRKVKESQQEALSIIGLEGLDEEINSTLLKASELTKSAITVGEEIDIKSDEAYSKIQEIIAQIESLTEKR